MTMAGNNPQNSINRHRFPDDFLWGASTAAHQVEGGTNNQWSVWELANAAELARSAEQRLGWLSDWQGVKDQACDPQNYVSGEGVKHYERYAEDFDLVKKLQLNSFRFGVEWSRIQPQENVWSKEAIAHYHEYIDALLERGIEPVLNIWHWTMPTWFTDLGGFEKKENLALFDAFVAKVAEEYADKVQYVITLNEPNVYATFSYLSGEWPPQVKKPLQFVRVYRNLMKAHKRAYAILKSRRSTLRVGVAAQLGNVQAKRPHNIFDGLATKAMRWFWNWWFLNSIRKYQDFVGINYYFTDYYKGLSFSPPDHAAKQGNDMKLFGIQRANPALPLNDLGWYMEPEGLYPLLVRTWARYKKPIIVTESGVADQHDRYRQWWVEESVIAMQRAMSEGVDVKGYMHWSLLDNFEWAFGWWPKFGLIEVDREDDMRRIPRPSALWLARYVRELRNGGPAIDRPAVITAPGRTAKPARPVATHPSTAADAAATPAQPTAASTPSAPVSSSRKPRQAQAPARNAAQVSPQSSPQASQPAARRIRPRRIQ